VTRASRRVVEFVLRLAGLTAVFECVVCADDVAAGKPDPEGHRIALARLARKRPGARSRSLAREDARRGVRAARAAGTRVAAVGSVPAHSALAADAYIQSLEGHTLSSLARLVTHGQERVNHG
jgi:sugar-phosphatase